MTGLGDTRAGEGQPAPRAVALVGPTAAGKSRAAIELAQRFELPILVCDSVKVYRGLDIGSAKPAAELRRLVRHELLDLVDPDEAFSAGDYARLAFDQLAGGPALFVGGTGFYLRAVAMTGTSYGDQDASRDSPERGAFEADWLGTEAAERGAIHEALRRVDPEAAAAIHPANVARALRALWLCRCAGGPISARRAEDPPRPRLALLVLELDPGHDSLREAIARRLDGMLAGGFLAEVENLRARGYHAGHKAMRSVGYRQLLDVLDGTIDLAGAREAILAETWQYSRRQRTYFRRQFTGFERYTVRSPEDLPLSRIEAFLRSTTT